MFLNIKIQKDTMSPNRQDIYPANLSNTHTHMKIMFHCYHQSKILGQEILLVISFFIEKGSIYLEDVINSKFDASNNIASKYTKQKWIQLERKIHKFTVAVGHFNAFL